MLDMKRFNLTKLDEELVSLIKKTNQKVLALWAIDYLSPYLPYYKEKFPNDKTIEISFNILKDGREDKITKWNARKYCWTILKRAREIEKENKEWALILRGASHTLATCHVRTHAEGSAMYVLAFLKYQNENKEDLIQILEKERKEQDIILINFVNSNRRNFALLLTS